MHVQVLNCKWYFNVTYLPTNRGTRFIGDLQKGPGRIAHVVATRGLLLFFVFLFLFAT